MLSRQWISRLCASLAGAAMLAASVNSAPAFTLPAPSIEQRAAAAPVEKVWCCGGWGCGGCGWGPFAVVGAVGALAAGIVAAPVVAVGNVVAGPYYYGPGYYRPAYYGGPGPGWYGPRHYGPCWRRVAGPWGWRWARVC